MYLTLNNLTTILIENGNCPRACKHPGESCRARHGTFFACLLLCLGPRTILRFRCRDLLPMPFLLRYVSPCPQDGQCLDRSHPTNFDSPIHFLRFHEHIHRWYVLRRFWEWESIPSSRGKRLCCYFWHYKHNRRRKLIWSGIDKGKCNSMKSEWEFE